MTEINPEIADRAKADFELIESTLADVGVELKIDETKQFFATGTEFLASGKSVWKSMRKAIDDLPFLVKGLDAFNTVLTNEDRKDIYDSLALAWISETGRLEICGKSDVYLEMTDNAWNQIRTRAPKELSERLSNNLNKWMGSAEGQHRFRTRKQGEGRELYALLSYGNSRSYQPFDASDAVETVRRLMPKDSKIRIDYERATTRWSIECVFPNPIDVSEAGVGSVHHLGVRLSGADNGTKKFMTEFFVIRARCINCTTITDSTLYFNKPHKGIKFTDHIQEILNKSSQAMASFSNIWQEANTSYIHNKYDGTPLSAEKTFAALIEAEYVKVDGMTNEKLLEHLISAWNLEPGDTAAHINQAITRMAHNGEFNTWTMQELETQAGELLYNRVYELEVR